MEFPGFYTPEQFNNDSNNVEPSKKEVLDIPEKEKSLAQKIALEIKRGGNDYLNDLFKTLEKMESEEEKEKVLEEITSFLKDWDIEKHFLNGHWSFTDSSADSRNFYDAKKIADFFLKYNFITPEQKEEFYKKCDLTWEKLRKES